MLEKFSGSSDSSTDSNSSAGANHRLLLIDDDQDQLALYEHLLNKEGYQVCCCASAKEAIELINKETFNLIISDLRMPELDGEELIRHLRGHKFFGKRCNLPLIILTGADIDMELDLLKLGADMYCKKAHAHDRLVPQIRFLLAQDTYV